jgi:hypothetical protein
MTSARALNEATHKIEKAIAEKRKRFIIWGLWENCGRNDDHRKALKIHIKIGQRKLRFVRKNKRSFDTCGGG